MILAVHPPISRSPFISYGRRGVTDFVLHGGIRVA